MISLYILNTVTNTLVHFDTNSSAPGVSAGFDNQIGAGETMSIPLQLICLDYKSELYHHRNNRSGSSFFLDSNFPKSRLFCTGKRQMQASSPILSRKKHFHRRALGNRRIGRIDRNRHSHFRIYPNVRADNYYHDFRILQ